MIPSEGGKVLVLTRPHVREVGRAMHKARDAASVQLDHHDSVLKVVCEDVSDYMGRDHDRTAENCDGACSIAEHKERNRLVPVRGSVTILYYAVCRLTAEERPCKTEHRMTGTFIGRAHSQFGDKGIQGHSVA